MMRTQWSSAELKKMPAVVRSNRYLLLQPLQLLLRPLTPHRPHPLSNRPHPRPPLLHRTLLTSKGRWRAAANRRGAGGKRYVHENKRFVDVFYLIMFSLFFLDGWHHWHQLSERPDGHLWREPVLRGESADDCSERWTYTYTELHITTTTLCHAWSLFTEVHTHKDLTVTVPFSQ